MRAFVTGGHGFVGTWLVRHLEDQGDTVAAPHASEVDITDGAALAKALDAARPDAVYHLAGFAHVGQSWERPDEVFRVNAEGTLHVLEAARLATTPAQTPRVLVVSSAEVYGTVTPDDLPLTEDRPVRPVSPYAASKAAAELLAVQAWLGRRVPALIARPFNHMGPGQSPDFVVPAFARRIMEAQGAVKVGNLTARRDITDVRDVVRAYRLLVERGEPGQAYNVCSGTDVSIQEVVDRLRRLAGKPDLALEPDPDLLRPADVPVLRGDPSRLHQATGWRPEIPLDQTLTDVLDSLRPSPEN
ncbi:MAG TPA: GDP-mannose 4,6-dehydratase [Acidimicrobiales bacterium]|jgi:GDP-4-dehydro-6-deoxy-D-mannose reductase|nr:GDP-mannose 4,6-dehydratase [Acidimicrobiales bacterium]